MPSISQAKLDEIEKDRAKARAESDAARAEAERSHERIRKFDSILDKVVRAAEGRSLIDDRNRFQGGYATPYMSAELVGNGPHKLKTTERQEQEIRSLNERIVNLEARLAAAVAVATFAREHKA